MFEPPKSTSPSSIYSPIHNAWQMLNQFNAVENCRHLLELALVEQLSRAGKYTAEEYWIQVGLADTLHHSGDIESACTLLLLALVQVSAAFGDEHVLSALAKLELARRHANLGRFQTARELMDEGLRVLQDMSSVSAEYSAELIQSWLDDFQPRAEIIRTEAPGQTHWRGLADWKRRAWLSPR